jgi:hypothetical protein
MFGKIPIGTIRAMRVTLSASSSARPSDKASISAPKI